LVLDEDVERARGFDPYDSPVGVKSRDPWKGQKRG
jgi:hypothetical protein